MDTLSSSLALCGENLPITDRPDKGQLDAV